MAMWKLNKALVYSFVLKFKFIVHIVPEVIVGRTKSICGRIVMNIYVPADKHTTQRVVLGNLYNYVRFA